MQNTMSGGNRAQLITHLTLSLHLKGWWWQHHAMGMLFSGRDWETCQDRGNNEWSQIPANPWGEPASECKRSSTVAKIYVPTGQWPPSIQLKQHRNGFKTRTWKSLSGPAKAQTWIRLRICGKTWRLLFTNTSPSTLTELEQICKEEWEKIPKSRFQSWYIQTYPRRLKAVITAKGTSRKYWLRVLNTYWCKTFQLFIYL